MWCELTWNGDKYDLPVKRVYSSPEAFSDRTGLQHPKTVHHIWPTADLNKVGRAPVIENKFDTKNYRSSGFSDEFVSGVVRRTHTVDTKDLDYLKNKKKSLLKGIREAHITGGVNITVRGKKYLVQTTDLSQLHIISGYMLAKDGFWLPPANKWRMADNSSVEMSASDVMAMAVKVAGFVSSCYSVHASHEASIDALATGQEVIDYDIQAEWPSNA